MAEKVEVAPNSDETKDGNSPAMLGDYLDSFKTNLKPLSNIPSIADLPSIILSGKSRQGMENVRDAAAKAADSKNVDVLVDKLGISMAQKTNPEVMKDVLHNVMKLDDCPAVMKLVGAKLEKPESMAPMLETVKKSLLDKHPALCELLAAALKENLIPTADADGKKTVDRTLHHMVLLNAITKGMVEDPKVAEEVQDRLLKKRRELGIRDGFFESAADMIYAEGLTQDSLFLAIKTKSIDYGMDLFREFRKQKELLPLDSLLGSVLVSGNIAEACGADLYFGLRDNARAGFDMIMNAATQVSVAGKERAVKYNLSQDWDSLYETWNMAFVSTLNNVDRRFAKLLIPQVIDAKPEDYIFNRGLALWLTLNFDHFHAIENRKNVTLPNSRRIAEIWGSINRRYGERLGK